MKANLFNKLFMGMLISSLAVCSTAALADDDINNTATSPAMSGNMSNPGANNPDNMNAAPQNDDSSNNGANSDDQSATPDTSSSDDDTDD